MRKFKILPLLLLLLTLATSAAAQKKTQKTYIPWSNLPHPPVSNPHAPHPTSEMEQRQTRRF